MNLTLGTPAVLDGDARYVPIARLSNGVLAIGGRHRVLDGQGGIKYYVMPGVLKVAAGVDPVRINGAATTVQGGPTAVVAITETKFVVFFGSYAWVCTWNGTTVSVGATQQLPLNMYRCCVARLTDTTFVVAGQVMSVGNYAYVCTVNGTTITSYARVTLPVYGTPGGIVGLDSNRFVLTYADNYDDNPRVIAGTRSGGTTITLGSPVALSVAYPLIPSPEKVSSNMVVIAYKSILGKSAAMTMTVNGTTITKNGEFTTYGSTVNLTKAHGCCVLPPVHDGLWPRRMAVSFYADVQLAPYHYYRNVQLMQISASGVISNASTPVRVGYVPNYEYNGSRLVALSQWELVYTWVNSYIAYNQHGAIDPETMALSFTVAEALSTTESMDKQIVRSLSEMLSVLAHAAVVPNKVAKETLALDESIAFLSTLIRYLSEGIPLFDTWELGGDAGLRKTFGERLGLSDDVINNPHKLAQEIIAMYDRLRLGGVFDDPVSRITTAILKAGLKTEKL